MKEGAEEILLGAKRRERSGMGEKKERGGKVQR